MSFAAKQLGFAYGLQDASFELPPNGLITIAGPNGAGKSTLLGILAGLRSPYRGSCTYDGREIRQWPRRDFAKRVAFLPQSVKLEFPFTAQEVVLMGRTPYASGWFQTAEDHAAAEEAMSITDTLAFRARDFRTLSGGERQRVILASALTQRPQVLLLDEPATHLDLRHQLSLCRMLAELARTLLVVAVTHDLNIALQFSHRVMVLADGRMAGDGAPREVLTPLLIAQVFGVQATVQPGPRPWMTYEA
ncbi:MAG TPA: ABC transporter ATP-binding protein [Bryobacteraceae bacterium]